MLESLRTRTRLRQGRPCRHVVRRIDGTNGSVVPSRPPRSSARRLETILGGDSHAPARRGLVARGSDDKDLSALTQHSCYEGQSSEPFSRSAAPRLIREDSDVVRIQLGAAQPTPQHLASSV
jgi:hypothetical protein